jgi:malate dehydrogenase
MRNKISVIGSGNVGASVAQFLSVRDLGDISLFDIIEGASEGKALDMMEGTPHWGVDNNIKGYTTIDRNVYSNLAGSDVIVVTAGLARKPGMTRDDLLSKNVQIIKDIAENVKKYAPDAVVVIVSNPADTMAYAFQKVSGMKPEKIMGLGGSLDSARFRTFLAMELGVSVEDVNAFVIGGHGDDMVPFIRYSSVSGIPITTLLSREKIDEIVQRTRFGGGEIVNLLKTGSAYYAPGISITAMVESIIKDRKRVIPCAAYINKENSKHYSAEGLFIGVPIKIGEKGVEHIYRVEFNSDEKALWDKTVKSVTENAQKVDQFLSSN